MNQNPLQDSKHKLISISDLIRVTLDYLDNANEILKEINENNNNYKPFVYEKEDGEKFTEGDWVLQKYFEELFQLYFPSITIIGEEDTTFAVKTNIDYQKYLKHEAKRSDISFDLSLSNEVIEQSDLTVYIDPIDATNQYISGNYEPVTVLIGICLKNIPFIGFIHYPLIAHPVTYFNIPSKGIYTHYSKSSQILRAKMIQKSLDSWTFNISKVNNLSEKKHFISKFPNPEIINQNKGLGHKSMLCILNDQVYVSINKGLGLWDICAADCISHELGGGYFDFDFTPISYIPKRTWYDKTMFLCSSLARRNEIQTIISAENKN